jgi:hypothetical protein
MTRKTTRRMRRRRTTMATTNDKTTIQLIVQQGGSSCEWYSVSYDGVEDAEHAIRGFKAHTYNAIGPFPVPEKLAEAFRAVPGSECEFLSLLDEVLVAATSRKFSEIEPDSCPACDQWVGPEDTLCHHCGADLCADSEEDDDGDDD